MNRFFLILCLIFSQRNIIAQYLIPDSLAKRGVLLSKFFDVTVPFEEKLGGLMILKIQINDQERRFLFDTGAFMNVIDSAAMMGLGLEKIGYTNATDAFGNERGNDVFHSNNVKMSGISLSEATFYAAPLPPVIKCQGVEGIIGITIINKFNWIIDYDNKTVRMTDKKIEKEAGGKEVYYYAESNVHKATLELGQDVFEDCTLDFGSNGEIEFPATRINDLLEKKRNDGSGTLSIGTTTGLHGKSQLDTVFNCYIPNFTLREIRLDSTEVTIDPQSPYILIGVGVFSRYKIAIDNTLRRYIFYPRQKQDFEVNPKKRPLGLEWDDGKIIVSNIRLCSSLTEVSVNDEVKSINGKKAKDFADYCAFDQWISSQNDKDWEVILNKNKCLVKKEVISMVKDCR